MSESNDTPVVTSTSIINLAVESVMDLIDALGLFSSIKRGALGTGNYLCCEIGPSTPDEIYMDKTEYIPLDLTINGKHSNLSILSDTMNGIHENLTVKTSYPSGNGWKIVDIQTMSFPQVIGREPDNLWMMASSLYIKIKTKEKTEVPEIQQSVEEPANESDETEGN